MIVVENAMAALDAGEVDVRGAVVHAAVHAWCEGHIEGEDTCPGCRRCGVDVGRGVLWEIWIRDALPDPMPEDET